MPPLLKRIPILLSEEQDLSRSENTIYWKNSAVAMELFLAVMQNRIPVRLQENSMAAVIASTACSRDFGIRIIRQLDLSILLRSLQS